MYQSLAEFNDVPIGEYPEVRTVDVASYMNHSCAPTCWFVQGGEDDEYEGLMVATRDLAPGDELSYDYCTSEDCDLTPAWDCHCGAAQCRGLIDPQDWRRPELQERYRGHFLPHISLEITSYQARLRARRHAAAAGKAPAEQAEAEETVAAPLEVTVPPGPSPPPGPPLVKVAHAPAPHLPARPDTRPAHLHPPPPSCTTPTPPTPLLGRWST